MSSYQTHDFAQVSSKDIYRYLVGAIVPRPIAFVSTRSLDGLTNLAPFSFYNGVSSHPPCLVFSVTLNSDGSKKDTLVNIEATGEFVVNSTHEWLAEKINACSAAYPHGVSEIEKVGFTPLPSTFVRPPRLAEALIQMECKVEKLVTIGEGLGSATLVVGRIVCMHVSEDVLTNGNIDLAKYQPLSRLGGSFWGKSPEPFELVRPGKTPAPVGSSGTPTTGEEASAAGTQKPVMEE